MGDPGHPQPVAASSPSGFWAPGRQRAVNRELEAKARAIAGLKGYVTNLQACPDGTPVTAGFVIGAYHQLFQIGKSFRMAKGDLQARPIYHRKRDPIEAHLSMVFAALAVSRWIEARTGWPIRKFGRPAAVARWMEGKLVCLSPLSGSIPPHVGAPGIHWLVKPLADPPLLSRILSMIPDMQEA